MEIENRKSVFDDLNKYCIHAKEHNYIEVSEWSNGEGWDINIGRSNETKRFSLTYGELEAINYLVKVLEYEETKS